MNVFKRNFLGVAFIICTGCASGKPALEGQINPHLGAAVQHNITAHAVPASAAQKANTYIPANPARAALARKNYEENTIDKTSKPKTQSVDIGTQK